MKRFALVRDCEHIRQILLGQKENPDDRKWTLLGQSYGGWCSFTYLSFFPEGLKEVFLTGGMAGLMPNPDHDYEKLVRTSISLYYTRVVVEAVGCSRESRGKEWRVLREISSGCQAGPEHTVLSRV